MRGSLGSRRAVHPKNVLRRHSAASPLSRASDALRTRPHTTAHASGAVRNNLITIPITTLRIVWKWKRPVSEVARRELVKGRKLGLNERLVCRVVARASRRIEHDMCLNKPAVKFKEVGRNDGWRI